MICWENKEHAQQSGAAAASRSVGTIFFARAAVDLSTSRCPASLIGAFDGQHAHPRGKNVQ